MLIFASTRSRPAPGPSAAGVRAVIVYGMDGALGLIEFPADDPDRARRFWSGLLGWVNSAP